MNTMVVFALLLLCFTSTFAVPPTADYFAGRSADIVIQSSSSVQDSVVFLKGDHLSTTQFTTLASTSFSDLFSHVMGTQSFHVDADRTGFPSASLFNKPKAALIVAIDSVGAEILSKYPALSLLKDSHSATITTPTSPTNTHTLLATLATGTTASKHGIVGASWRKPGSSERVNAYDADGLSYAANLADILLQETRGKGLIVSASALPSFASSLAAHPELVSENLGWNAHAYSLSARAFASRYAEPSCDQVLALSAEEIATLVSELTVSVGNEQVTFNPKIAEDFALLAELTFVSNLINKLKTNAALSALVADNTPDMYSFVFSSLKAIQTRYGQDSAAFSAALTLVDKATSSLLSALNELYSSRVATSIIALNARDTSSEATRQVVYNKVAMMLYEDSDFATDFPVIYVRPYTFMGIARDRVCSGLQNALKDTTVYCMTPNLPTRNTRALNAAYNNATNNTNNSDYKKVWSFWLNFWITVVLISFIGWGVYNLAYIGSDASKDSLLFRVAGRHHHQN